MRALATRWSSALSSSLQCYVSGIRKVSGNIIGNVYFASTPAFGLIVLKPALFGSIAKDVSARVTTDIYNTMALSSGNVNVILRGNGIVAHVDESRGTVTIIGPENKVGELLELLEQGYFATMSIEEEITRPKYTQFTTAAPRVNVASTQLYASCVPLPFFSFNKCSFASNSEKPPSSATRPLKAFGNFSWSTFASGES